MNIHWITKWVTVTVILVGIAVGNAANTSRVYVEFKPGQGNAAAALVKQAGGRLHHTFDNLNAIATTLPTSALEAIRSNPNVVLVEDDPPRSLSQCEMRREQYPYGLNAVQAPQVWNENYDGSGIKVGVIDSGVWTGHQDFFVDGVPVPMTGYPDGWNTDHDGHGTHVTGTIVAQLNRLGVVGVSPGASIHMVKVFGEDGGWIYSSSLLAAAQHCQSAGCKVINMSLGGGRPSRIEERGMDELYSAGILLVAAAGNAGDNSTSFPAGYASVISVGAVDASNAVADFSQKNSDVELAAPGVGVLSTVGYCEENTASGTGFNYSGNHIEFAARGTVSGILVDGGLAGAVDPAWNGKVVLVQRGTYSFYDKVINVQNSGGVACIIYNNAPGNFLGTLGDGNSSLIPAISLSQEDGTSLLKKLGEQTTVSSSVTFDQSAWASFDGTSMATPHVCAVAALIWSAAPGKPNTEIREALTATALDLGDPGRDIAYGYGLVQASDALAYLIPPNSDTTPPKILAGPSFNVLQAKRGVFSITWTTDEASTSEVILNGSLYRDPNLVTDHIMTFQGRKHTSYTYSVRSADAAGNVVESDTYTGQL